MDQRIARQRDPYLRQRVPRERLATSWTGLVPSGKAEEDLAAFRARLKALGPYEREAPATAAPRPLEMVETGDGRGP